MNINDARIKTATTKNKQTVVVTGCSSGIGLSCVKALEQNGFNVIATVRNSNDIPTVKAACECDIVLLDLASSESIKNAVKQIVELAQGELFALFNNAAYGQPGAVEDLTRSVLREQFETNLFGTHELTCELLPYLLAQEDARIIQNSSVLGFAAMPFRGAYNASKFALEGLTDTLRMELATTSVRVSLIEPGPITSRFRKNALVAFERNIHYETSRFSNEYQQSLKRLNREGAASSFTLPPEAVAKKLIMALKSKKPKARYYVTFPTYLFAYLRHLLPTYLLDKILIKAGNA